MFSKPKKRLGQSFLIDKNIQRKIIASLELKPSDIILEIGSGRGELTGSIAEKVKKIYALELDADLCLALRDKFKDYDNIKIINQDILKFDLEDYFSRIKKRIKVVGNIPYYISSPIIERLIRFRNKIDIIFITVQKEFAHRIIASPGSKEYGSLSCFVQFYLEPRITFQIKKTCFFPQPKVDSCCLRLNIRRRPLLNKRQQELFFKITRAAFNQRRKTLRNSLRGVIPGQRLETFFRRYSLDPNIRPEDLSPQDFANLVNL